MLMILLLFDCDGFASVSSATTGVVLLERRRGASSENRRNAFPTFEAWVPYQQVYLVKKWVNLPHSLHHRLSQLPSVRLWLFSFLT